jgi:hypothetical protein
MNTATASIVGNGVLFSAELNTDQHRAVGQCVAATTRQPNAA